LVHGEHSLRDGDRIQSDYTVSCTAISTVFSLANLDSETGAQGGKVHCPAGNAGSQGKPRELGWCLLIAADRSLRKNLVAFTDSHAAR
jgi:hypothetical protein